MIATRSIKLADECELITKGSTPSTLGLKLHDGGVPFIRAQNLVGGTVSVEADPLFIDPATHEALRRSKIRPADVLLSIAGTIGRAAIVPDDIEEMNCNQAVAIIRPSSQIDRRFLLHWFSSADARSQIAKGKVTATISNLSLGEIGNLKVPLPPLDEQRRIAAILDKAVVLRRNPKRAFELLDSLTQSIFLEMFGDTGALERIPFGDAVYFQEGPGVRNWQFRDSGTKLINVKNIVDGSLVTENTDRYLDPLEVTTKYSHFLLNAGELVMASSGVTWGKIAEVYDEHLPLCLNTSMIRLRPLKRFSKAFVRSFVEYGDFRDQIAKVITGSAQPNFGPSHLRMIEIPAPGFQLQQAFENKIQVLAQRKLASQKQLLTFEALFSSLQHYAFLGQL